MKRIGLIGGMSFESTAIYYQKINEMVRQLEGGFASADIMLHSVNFADIVAFQRAGDWAAAADYLSKSAKALESAGADCILICTNTMHKVADDVEHHAQVPLINIIDVTAQALKAGNVKRPLLLATRYTMEDGFYDERMARHDVSVMTPDEPGRIAVHDIIFNELCAGQVYDASRQRILELIEKAKAEGADGVILGCTEICMLISQDMISLPVFDSTELHARAAVEFSLREAPGDDAETV